MEQTIKILAAVTGVLVAVGEVFNQANKYLETRKVLKDLTDKKEETATNE